jgi:hypothetical protein
LHQYLDGFQSRLNEVGMAIAETFVREPLESPPKDRRPFSPDSPPGSKVDEGLVGIADTRVISGNENISARKVSVFGTTGGPCS